ncbi:MAG: energy transducer TonB [Deltaproteobacteria bacterium]|nr:energy transducer TonB [Deltaproteobacteria bacterium]
MNNQTRALLISFLLHSLMIVLVLIGSSFMGQYKKAMILDFDLSKPLFDGKEVESPAPAPLIKAKSVDAAAHQIFKEEEPRRLPEEVTKISANPEITPTVKVPETHEMKNRPMEPGGADRTAAVKESSFGITGGAKEKSVTNSGTGSSDNAKEAARVKYLNENFAYIRDKILRNVSYPDTARRRGWQGKIVLSFVIGANGSVKDFKIIKSTGYAMLDNSAIDTVKDTAPFPRPPGEAQLVIPIVYRLE